MYDDGGSRMTTILKGADYAWARPSITVLKANGVQAVLRYLGPSSWGKTITQGEYDSLVAAGIIVAGLVFEADATDSTGGYAKGVAHAQEALAYAPVGYTGPIYLAADKDLIPGTPAFQTALTYFAGAHSVLGTRTGAYGDGAILKATIAAGTVFHTWLSDSTSFPTHDSEEQIATVVQSITGPLATTDGDTVRVWTVKPPKPHPKPVPSPPKGTAMISLTSTGNGYWCVEPNGAVFSFGDATYHGGPNTGGGSTKKKPVLVAGDICVGISGHSTLNGLGQILSDGYVIFTEKGNVYAYGDVSFHGSPASLSKE